MDSDSRYVKDEYPFSEITGRIIGAAQRVHLGLGSGFMEVIYQRALALELHADHLAFEREVWMDVRYRDQVVGHKRVDFVIEGVMVEIKAKAEIADADIIQTISYLKASNFEIGLLLNFGTKKLEIKRFIHN
ncbi:MAG: GxxExxY protein [Anaerolineales bacterium]|nr:GxxExxY protein [Anaerolineales bacterium]